jgi:hypothetical protein
MLNVFGDVHSKFHIQFECVTEFPEPEALELGLGNEAGCVDARSSAGYRSAVGAEFSPAHAVVNNGAKSRTGRTRVCWTVTKTNNGTPQCPTTRIRSEFRDIVQTFGVMQPFPLFFHCANDF